MQETALLFPKQRQNLKSGNISKDTLEFRFLKINFLSLYLSAHNRVKEREEIFPFWTDDYIQ